MLVAHVFKQSTRNLAYCNVSVSFVHDDYRSDVEAAWRKCQCGWTCTGPSVTLGSPPYYESAIRRAGEQWPNAVRVSLRGHPLFDPELSDIL